jgi:DNA invertase Pin-like site-specific DNA recombinase
MKGHGCVNIHIEETKDKKRIEWCKFIDSLSNGDSAVFASFDNVFHNFNDMMFFIKYCSKMDIRIISLSDELDTHDKLFPERGTADTLNLICKVFSKRDRASHDDLEAELYSYSFEDRKLKRYKLVINMYKAGYSVKEIMERTGYRGKSNIYRILHQYDIEMEYPSMSRTANKVREKSI